MSSILPSSVASSAISSVTSAVPSYINLGLWSYCTLDSSKKVVSCTSPKGIQKFNLNSLIYDNIEDNQVLSLLDSISSLVLPSNLQDKMTYYNDLVKCMFITILIGIVVTFLNLVVNLIRWVLHLRLLNWIGIFFSLIGFLSLLISVGTGMGTYIYISHLLKDDYDQYGISLSLGRNYLGILWGSVAAALLNLLLWQTVRYDYGRTKYVYATNPIDEKPLL